jgi:hypothetical protein
MNVSVETAVFDVVQNVPEFLTDLDEYINGLALLTFAPNELR